MIQKFIHKMAFIEAMQWLGKESFEELFKLANVDVNIKAGEENIAQIKILEQLVDIKPNDYVIKFNHDKFCVCNSEIFENTFSNIEEILFEQNRLLDTDIHKNLINLIKGFGSKSENLIQN